MGGWKKEYGEDEIEIFEKVLLSKRGDYWHFRLWLEKEKKYVRRSLKTRKRQISQNTLPLQENCSINGSLIMICQPLTTDYPISMHLWESHKFLSYLFF